MQGRYDDAREELEALAEFISEGLAAPVSAIQSLAASLIEDNEENFDEFGREQARLLIEEAARLSETIRELSEYSRISRATVELEPVSLDEIVDGVLRRLRAKIEANGASASVTRPLGQATGDPAILFPVLSNLIEGALKRAGPEAPKVVIAAAPAAGTNRVRLWVEHNGAGAGGEDGERIFHLFHRPDAAAYSAAWPRLAIVKKGIEKLGGSAGAEPATRGGSRFWIEIPAGPAA